MEENKKITIIIDDAVATQNLAKNISDVIRDFPFVGFTVLIIDAKQFMATDLLPANVFFLGCESPKPGSFDYIEDLFEHINLAGRKCGIFSSNGKAIEYLGNLIKKSEASIGVPLISLEENVDKTELKDWIHSIFKQGNGDE